MPDFLWSIDGGEKWTAESGPLPFNLPAVRPHHAVMVRSSAPPVTLPADTDAAPAVTAIFFGQSELEYLFNRGVAYRALPQPALPEEPNLTVYSQTGTDAPVVKTLVTAEAVAAGQVNPAMAALSAFLAFAMPGQFFAVGDGAVPGTSRFSLADDSTDASDDRKWSDFTSVVDALETDHDSVQHLIECWYNADAAYINNFKANFWPLYFGANADGSRFEIGSTNQGRRVDHILFDGHAAAGDKGRGVFARSGTDWSILTPMPFANGPATPESEAQNFSQGNPRLTEPSRAVMQSLTGDPFAQSVDLVVGPSAHLCKFGGASTLIHPDTENPDGQILFMWPFALALLRAAGHPVHEPEIAGIEGPEDGAYADLLVDLPNGGNLTTLAALRAANYAGDAPHQQPVTGVEITRSGVTRRPVFKTTQTAYPENTRGTVVVVDAGSGSPRRGRVRVTPDVPFGFGDSLSYLRGQATAALLRPRDLDLYPWFLVEHIPALYDPSATYPFEGIAVAPYQADLAAPVAAPDFEARGAHFDGASWYSGLGLSLQASSKGLMSLWIKRDEWSSGQIPFEVRQGGSVVMNMVSASNGRISFRLPQRDGTYAGVFTTSTNTFKVGEWNHALWAWDFEEQRFQIYVNGSAINTSSYLFDGTNLRLTEEPIDRMGVGAAYGAAAASRLTGDLAHLYCNMLETMDISLPENRAKFVVDGRPVALGNDGSLPTGTAPEFYYDGDAPSWSNRGRAGNVPLTGALTPSPTQPEY